MVGYYEYELRLPRTDAGYYNRVSEMLQDKGINNLSGHTNDIGATYSAIIPRNLPLANAPANNSAHFIGASACC